MSQFQELAKQFAVYPEANTSTVKAMNYPIVGLGGEVGELLNKWHKFLRGDYALTDERVEAIRKELGGIRWMFAMVCNEFGFNERDVEIDIIARLHDRHQRGVIKGDSDDR